MDTHSHLHPSCSTAFDGGQFRVLDVRNKDAVSGDDSSKTKVTQNPRRSLAPCQRSNSKMATFTSRKVHFLMAFLLTFLMVNPVPVHSAPFSSSDFDIFRYRCPDKCICVPDVVDTNLLIITCQLDHLEGSKTFVDFPKNATKGLTLKCLSHQHDSTFADDMFEGFKQLKDLRIGNCHTLDLPSNSFRGLSSLKSLYVSRMTNASPPGMAYGLFKPVATLEKLTLTESMIKQFPDGIFCPLTKLQILNVTANRLTSVKVNTDANPCQLPQLIILDASSNLLESINSDDLSAVPGLRQLSVRDNDLLEFHQDAFKKVQTLQHVDFEDNDLSEMPPLPEGVLHLNLAKNRFTVIPAAVANCNKLISINMSYNNIDSSTPFSLLSESLETVDLSYNKFDTVPLKIVQQSLNSLLYLHLMGNQITVLQPNQLQNLTRLQKLDLSNNQLKTLNDDCFSGLNELIELSMKNNSIYHVDVGVFADVSKRLQKIDFSTNLLVELPMAVGKLSKMKWMDFSNNQISKMYKFVLNKMAHLSKLDLSGNKLLAVESYIFSDCPHLTELDLSNNRIELVAQDSFEKCPHLKNLDLSRNRISTFSGSLGGLKGLRHLNVSSNNMDILEWTELPDELLTLDASLNKINVISTATKSRVKTVNLKSNKITHMAKNQLCDQIEQIDLSSNLISSIAPEALIPLNNLKSINFQNNKIKVVQKKIFRDAEASLLNGLLTTFVFLENNPLDCSCEMDWIASLSTKTSIQIVDASTSRCRNLVTGEMSRLSQVKASEYLCSYEQTCEPQCICCQYGNCDCKSRCPEGCACYHDQDYKTNVVYCKRQNQTAETASDSSPFNPKTVPMHATHVYLEGLDIKTLKSHDFMSRARLTELRINGSNITTIQPLAFNTLPSLKRLDLSSNKLTELRGDEIFKAARIEDLNLDNNNLYEIDTRLLEQLPNLEAIGLKNNQFEALPEIFLTESKILRTAISGNPFRCDCDYRRFKVQAWVLENRDKIVDFEGLNCVENVTSSFINNDTTVLTAFAPTEGDDIFTMPMAEFLERGNDTICAIEADGIFGGGPQRNLFLVISSALFLVFALFGLIVVVLGLLKKSSSSHRYVKAPPSLNCSTTPGSSPLPMPLIQYDAFISYSKRDEAMVVSQLCRRLEEEDYSLCLLHQEGSRHAYHGAVHNISDELIHQMEACNVLIIYLTKNFLENEWQTVQMKTAHRIFAKKRNKKLITVISDEIRPNELDGELGKILRSNTRLRFNDQLFWKLLMNAMPLKTNSQHSSGSTILGDGSDIYSEMYGSIVPSEVV